jgi:hypothetical protein
MDFLGDRDVIPDEIKDHSTLAFDGAAAFLSRGPYTAPIRDTGSAVPVPNSRPEEHRGQRRKPAQERQRTAAESMI